MRLLEQVLIAERPHDARFATACAVRIKPNRSEAVIVSAGHTPPLVITHQGQTPLTDPVITAIGEGHGKTTAQVMLCWQRSR